MIRHVNAEVYCIVAATTTDDVDDDDDDDVLIVWKQFAFRIVCLFEWTKNCKNTYDEYWMKINGSLLKTDDDRRENKRTKLMFNAD